MKIMAKDDFGFVVTCTEGVVGMSAATGDSVLTTWHDRAENTTGGGRNIFLPGEFEIGNILLKGVSSSEKNTIYKVTSADGTICHFGQLTAVPNAAMLEEVGENIAVAIIAVGKDFDAKKVDELIDKISPAVALICGDGALMPTVQAESGATKHEGEFAFSKAQLTADNTLVHFLV